MQHIGNKVDFKEWSITKYKKGYMVMIKESIHWKIFLNLSLYAQNNIASQCIKQKKKSFKGEIYTIIVGDFHIFL